MKTRTPLQPNGGLPKDNDYLIKSVQFYGRCYFSQLAKDLTHTDDKETQPRTPYRKGRHKKVTTYGEQIFLREEKKSPYPTNELHKKKYLSRHQSVSLVTPDAQSPVFKTSFTRANHALAGIILDPADALFNRFMIYDKNTVTREAYEYDDIEKARVAIAISKIENTLAPQTYPEFKEFLKSYPKKLEQHNEVLARIRWNIDSSAIGIFADNSESRYAALFYAEKIKKEIEKKIKDLPEAKKWMEGYEVPIFYYLPSAAENSKHYCRYTNIEQTIDSIYATIWIFDEDFLKAKFKSSEFAILLAANYPKLVLDICLDGESIILKLIELGQLVIADEMVQRAGIENLYVYLKSEGWVEKAAEKVKKNKGLLVDAVFRGHQQIFNLLLEIAPDLINERNDEGASALFMAAYFNDVSMLKVLIEHPNIHMRSVSNLSTVKNRVQNALLFCLSLIIPIVSYRWQAQEALLRNSILIHCVEQQNIEAVALLLSHPDIDVNQTCYFGNTPLMIAITLQNVEMVRLLLNHPDIRLDEKNRSGNTALAFALNGENEEIVKLVAAKAVNYSIQNENGMTPLDQLKLSKHRHLACFKDILEQDKCDSIALLEEYIQRREKGEDYKSPFKFSCVFFNFSKDQKIAAARFIKKLVLGESIGDVHQEARQLYLKVCMQGELGNICEKIGVVHLPKEQAANDTMGFDFSGLIL